MKYFMAVNFCLVSLNLKFHEDTCKNARARVVNAFSICFDLLLEN